MGLENNANIGDLLEDDHAWLAAEIRQIFRAKDAGDVQALKIAWFYFEDFVFKFLSRHLRGHCPTWREFRFFDGMKAQPIYLAPGRIRLRGEVAWAGRDEGHCYEPFDFEFQLCPQSGGLDRYALRFGDERPRSAKVSGSAVNGVPVGTWAFEKTWPTASAGLADGLF